MKKSFHFGVLLITLLTYLISFSLCASVPQKLAPTINLANSFKEVNSTLVYEARYFVPTETGKFEFILPKTKGPIAFRGELTSNIKFRGEVSVDTRITSTFGDFGYNLKHVLEAGKHSMLMWVTEVREVKRYFKNNPKAKWESDDDFPLIDVKIIYFFDTETIEAFQLDFEKLSTQSQTIGRPGDEL